MCWLYYNKFGNNPILIDSGNDLIFTENGKAGFVFGNCLLLWTEVIRKRTAYWWWNFFSYFHPVLRTLDGKSVIVSIFTYGNLIYHRGSSSLIKIIRSFLPKIISTSVVMAGIRLLLRVIALVNLFFFTAKIRGKAKVCMK